MKSKKLQLLRIGLLSAALGAFVLTNNLLPKTAFAVGDLNVDWGVPSGNPIFVVEDLAPGGCESRSVSVTNDALINREVGVRGVKTDEALALGSILEIEIFRTAPQTSLYGPETLDQFFTDSTSANAVSLLTQTPSETIIYDFTVCFPESAGNEFQNASVIFDLIIGLIIPTPEECLEMEFDNVIFGTAGNNNINGTPGNDLIFGLEGNDKIDGKGGHDCIAGGIGNDDLRGGSGNDVLSGESGNDKLDGGTGLDQLLGGEGNDKMDGGSDNDELSGGNGNDDMDGGSGDDLVEGNEDNDTVKGGSGNDTLHGGDGNDNLKGGSDNDSIDGGPGTNTLNGESGIDTCVNGPTITKCEP